ncbi:hypothetical protein CN962_20905 [Bacillus cereus]|uniref:hypothetical protein n=1 Tax=Bacillus cereus TaxID=1396 RepID=UPI000BFD2968|nr:hypothetical protein [Bacillus cereus]PGN46090.1 hypothetical protein CN962_20905 [Bacillus cereus]
MQNSIYGNKVQLMEEGLYSIRTTPHLADKQTAYYIQNKGMNILWDCVTCLDEKTIDEINELGGIQIIALSTPHFHTTYIDWAKAFNALIYIHEDNKKWVTQQSERIIFWSGEFLELSNGITLYRLGGKFKGGAVLHWKGGNDNKGVLFTSDIIQMSPGKKGISFMYSYSDLIPLPANVVKDMSSVTKGLSFSCMYDAFYEKIQENAYEVFQESANRYVRALLEKN